MWTARLSSADAPVQTSAQGLGGASTPISVAEGGTAGAPSKSRKPKASRAEYMFGRMTTKVYQLGESQLDELGRANRDTTVSSAIAVGAFGFAIDVTKDLMLASGAPVDKVSFFGGIGASAWVVGVVAALIAVAKWKERRNLIEKIKKQTDFLGQDEEA